MLTGATRGVHVRWLARDLRVPTRACVRERAAGLRCGGLASHRVLGECRGLPHHGNHQKSGFQRKVTRTHAPSLHGVGGPYKDRLSLAQCTEVCLETRPVPKPPLYVVGAARLSLKRGAGSSYNK